MLRYDTHEQANMRLHGTVLTYQGSAVYVQAINRETKNKGMTAQLWKYPLTSGTQGHTVFDLGEKPINGIVNIDLNDPDLNFRRFKVGYCNDYVRKTAGFITRTTARQQLQGLCQRGLTIPGNGRNIPSTMFFGAGFDEMLQEVYPDVKSTLNLITQQGWEAVAISNQFAVARDERMKTLFKLMYRNITVGAAVGKSFSHFTLDDKYQYLRETLVEEGVAFILDGSNG